LEFAGQVDKLAKAKLLFLVTEKFAGIDLHPVHVSDSQMGSVLEELIRKFAEPRTRLLVISGHCRCPASAAP
jgi:type I restriction enzyme M protein